MTDEQQSGGGTQQPGDPPARRMTLSWNSGAIVGTAVALIGLVLALAQTRQTLAVRAQLTEEVQKRATAVAKLVASQAAGKDKAALQGAADAAIADLDEVGYVAFTSGAGEPLAQALAKDLGGAALPKPEAAPGKRAAPREVTVGRAELLEVALPLDPRGSDAGKAGLVQVGVKLDGVHAQIRSAFLSAFGVVLLVLVLCTLAAVALFQMVSRPLQRLTQAALTVAQGNLEQELSQVEEGSNDVALLAKSFTSVVSNLRSMVADLSTAAHEIDRESEAMIKTVSTQSALTTQQASAINETSTTCKEIAQTSAQATERADSVVKVAQNAEEVSREGQQVIERAIEGMQALDEQVRAIALTITDLADRAVQIGDINQTVKDLAERSNMLALNASIEASKAGEQGRGFSVVAMEMRNLAEQSKQAAGQVREILGEVQKVTKAAVIATEEGSKRAQAAVGLTQSAANTIIRLAQVCQESSLAGRQIAGNTRQQTIGVEQIVTALRELSEASASSVSGTQEIERAAGNLKVLAGRLGEYVGRYRAG